MSSAFQPFRFSQHTLDLGSVEHPLPLRTARMLPVVTSHEPMVARNPNNDHSNHARAAGRADRIRRMSGWGIALIAAGSAILGSITSGFFAWKAGHRQAAAAETAGQAQAAALISTVQATLDEQRRVRAAEQRRQTYAAMLAAATEWETGSQNQTLNSQRPRSRRTLCSGWRGHLK
ncbi:hypothetical protein ACFV14_31175 [Streptomyces zaomyceticus]|uniref:hypothetical protein n=1 Tax=Streptomyces zaomyceticus TaxID=68286 RepID=UPI0036A73EFC